MDASNLVNDMLEKSKSFVTFVKGHCKVKVKLKVKSTSTLLQYTLKKFNCSGSMTNDE